MVEKNIVVEYISWLYNSVIWDIKYLLNHCDVQWISRGVNIAADGIAKYARDPVLDLHMLASLPSMVLDVIDAEPLVTSF